MEFSYKSDGVEICDLVDNNQSDVSPSVHQSASQLASRLVGRSVGRPVSRSVNRSISQSVSQSIIKACLLYTLCLCLIPVWGNDKDKHMLFPGIFFK